jgi:hypothetical protein
MRGALLARFCGNEPGVRVQTRRLAEAAAAEAVPGDIWDKLRRSDSDDDIVLRISTRPSRLPDVWEFARRLAEHLEKTRVHASVGRGIVRVSIPNVWQAELEHSLAQRPESSLIFERLPPHLWPVLVTSAEMNHRLNRGVREAFDPHFLLNPGILGESLA